MIEKPYAVEEIQQLINSHEYGAELLLQHAMLNIESLRQQLAECERERDELVEALNKLRQFASSEWVVEIANEALAKVGAGKTALDGPNANNEADHLRQRPMQADVATEKRRHGHW